MTGEDCLWRLGVAGLGVAYAAGRTDPETVVTELRGRMERLDPRLNAYVGVADDLEEQASDSAKRIADGAPRSALEGVPLAVKDNLVMAGLPAAWGGALFDAICPADELPVARLRAAGAILVGKTSCPEFAAEGYTASRTFGVTRNPWDLALTPGGSSGGAVAAVAAGLAVAAVGTDGGGSIRRPAGHTGLYGLKPGIGAVPRAGGLPQILLDFEVVGPLARNAADLRLLFDVMAGPDRSDPVSRGRLPMPARPERLRILRVDRFGEAPCDPAILGSIAAAAERLADLGHSVEVGTLPVDTSEVDAFWPKVAQVGLARLREMQPQFDARVAPPYRAMAETGATVSAAVLYDGLEAVRTLRQATGVAFYDWDLILTPTAAAQPWPAEQPFPTTIAGQSVGARGHAVYTGWVNAAGHPAIALPAPPDCRGIPVGVQLIGDLGTEALLLDLAEAYEASGPGWHWPEFAET